MCKFDLDHDVLTGPGGQLPVRPEDDLTRKLAMIIQGECGRQSRIEVAKKYGFSRQRYHQLRRAYLAGGAAALGNQKRGPKTNYRRTDEVIRQVIRYRFLDPDASAEVIAQKLRQQGRKIARRTVQRVLEEYGLQKKTLQISATNRAHSHRDPSHQAARAAAGL